MSALSCFLCYEYSYFKKQSEKLLELQEDYRTYIGAVNKILSDYNTVKAKMNEPQYVLSEAQKKKSLNAESQEQNTQDGSNSDEIFYYQNFPANYKVYSSADNCIESFFVVSRELGYLRDSALEFIRNQDGFIEILDNMDWSDWCEYTDYGLSKISVSDKIRKRAEDFKNRPKVVKRPTPKKLKKPKKVSSYASRSSSTSFPVTSRKMKKTSIKRKEKIRLSWPIKRSRFWISSLYGPRKKRSGAWGFHYGVDMAALKGTPVCAAYTGIVVEARYSPGYGNTIVMAHSRKHRTRYAHLSKILVKVGQKVHRGSVIGNVGDTGYVRSAKGKDASHLHFELIEFGKKINPLPYIQS